MMRLLRPDFISWWLAVPLLVAFWALAVAYGRTARRRSPTAARFARLSRRSTPARSFAALACGAVAAGGLVFALVRPQALLAARVPDYERQDVVFVLDRSASMKAHDVAPSRFRRATAEIRNFLRNKPDTIDRVGLVGFADASVVLSYLTADVDSVMFYLDWIDEDPTALLGTNIGAALRSARDVAQKDDRQTTKLFLLISDGEDYGAELENALTVFRDEGRRVHCIGVGSDAEVPVPLRQSGEGEELLRDDAGRTVTTKFEEATLRQIAATTGGRYLRSTTGRELAQAIADIVRGERKQVGWRTTTDYRDLYPVGLAVAAAAGAGLWLLL
jgi:Ca-activated chloride channel family protein